jgi:hypothetical protein
MFAARNFFFTNTSLQADYLIVAGGGAAQAIAQAGGGGGAGGLLASSTTLSILNTYTITVGAGWYCIKHYWYKWR